MKCLSSLKKVAIAYGIALILNSAQLFSANKLTNENAIARMKTITSFLSGKPKEVQDIFNIWAKSNEVIRSIDEYSRTKQELENQQQEESRNLNLENQYSEEFKKQQLVEDEFLNFHKTHLLEPIKRSLAVFHGLSLWIKPIAVESFGAKNFKETIINKFFTTPHVESADFFNREITDLNKLRTIASELATLSEDIFANLSKATIFSFIKECGKDCDKTLLKEIILEHKRIHSEAREKESDGISDAAVPAV